MNRKLHHSLSAFVAAAAFMVLGLVAAVPGTSTTGATSVVAQARPGIDSVVAAPVVTRSRASARRQRHRLAMPYFSFSSRS